MHVSCTLRLPRTPHGPFLGIARTSTKVDPLQILARQTFSTAHDQPQNTAKATSLHIAIKLRALRPVAKHRLLKVLQHSYITVETAATRIVTEIHRALFVRVQALLVNPLHITSQLQLKGSLRLQSDKTLNSKRGVRRKPPHVAAA